MTNERPASTTAKKIAATVLVGGVACTAAAAIMWRRRALTAGAGPRPVDAQNSAAPALAIPQNQPASRTAIDPDALFVTLDATQPGSSQTYHLIADTSQADPEAFANALAVYRKRHIAWVQQQEDLGNIQKEIAESLKTDILTVTVGNTIASGASAIPIIRQIIGAIWQVVKIFVEADERAKRERRGLLDKPELSSGGKPIFSGWDGVGFLYQEIPVLSVTIPIWNAQVSKVTDPGFLPLLSGLALLCEHSPLGYSDTVVTIENEGSFTYSFSATDGSRRTVTVYNPADITTLGPRFYDLAVPWAWRVPGAKIAWADLPGMRPVPWAGPYWSSYLAALASAEVGNLIAKNNPKDVNTLNGVLDGLAHRPPRDPANYKPKPGELPPGIVIPS